MIKFNKISLKIILFFVLLFTSITPQKTYASNYTFYVTPSKIYDENIAIGESKTFTIKVGSRIVDDTKTDYKDVSFNVEISTELEGIEGVKQDNSDIVKLSTTNLAISPGGSQEVSVTIAPTEKFISGNYVVYINFTQKNNSTNAETVSTTINNVLRVPIYLFIGSQEEYNNALIDFSIKDQFISLNNEYPKSIFVHSYDYMELLLNPFNIKNVFNTIDSKPYYNIKKGNSQIIDINNDIYVPLNEVYSSDLSKLTDTSYFNYTSTNKLVKINSANSTSEGICLNLENGDIEIIKCVDNNRNFILEQLSFLSKRTDIMTIDYLLSKLYVPKNINNFSPIPVYNIELINLSSVPLTVMNNFSLSRNNKILAESSVLSPTIETYKKDTFPISLSIIELPEGNYSITSNLQARDILKSINFNFKVASVRNSIKMYCFLFLTVYFTVVLLVILLIFKLLKSYIYKRKYHC